MDTFSSRWQSWTRRLDRQKREIESRRPVCPDCEHDVHAGPCLHMSRVGWCPCTTPSKETT